MASIINVDQEVPSNKTASLGSLTTTVVEKNKNPPPEVRGPVSSTFFDIDEECEGESCLLPDVGDRIPKASGAADHGEMLDRLVHAIPIFMPLFAYISYETIAAFSDVMIDTLSNKNFVAVDGGAFESKIIAPAINGVVVRT